MSVWTVALISFFVVFSKDIFKLIKYMNANYKKNMTGATVEKLMQGKTFDEDPGAPIWSFVIAGLLITFIVSNAKRQEDIIVAVLFGIAAILNYCIVRLFSTAVFIESLKNKHVKKDLVTKNFIFRKLLTPSFWWTGVIEFFLLFSLFNPEIPMGWKILLSILSLTVLVVVPICVCAYLVPKYQCNRCAALWAYDLVDEYDTDVQRRQQIRYDISNDMVTGRLKERPVLVEEETGVHHSIYECHNCGDRIHDSERFCDDGRSGWDSAAQNIMKGNLLGKHLFDKVTHPDKGF